MANDQSACKQMNTKCETKTKKYLNEIVLNITQNFYIFLFDENCFVQNESFLKSRIFVDIFYVIKRKNVRLKINTKYFFFETVKKFFTRSISDLFFTTLIKFQHGTIYFFLTTQ